MSNKRDVLRLGIDIGSTTIKLVILNESNDLIYRKYERHYSNIKSKVAEMLLEVSDTLDGKKLRPIFTGSGSIMIAQKIGLPFVQEVIATTHGLKELYPNVDVAIELGGEDAKIVYLNNGIEQRMNGSCAGGTGSFIDQMAKLLYVDGQGLNDLAKSYNRIYPIAARCGVFAKTDVQPLINEGVDKSDIAVSILQAVVVQTLSGLACGRPVRGGVAFLGGPLYHLTELRKRFEENLKGKADYFVNPEHGDVFVAIGAALYNESLETVTIGTLLERIIKLETLGNNQEDLMPILFEDNMDYEVFSKRHKANSVITKPIEMYKGDCYLGIDAGSTTTKGVLIDDQGQIIYSYYGSNMGNPVYTTIKILKEVYEQKPDGATIRNSCVTGYGEALIKAALKIDYGEIETMAHYKAAKFFDPEVDFIIDIGGQDMKCLKVSDGNIERIMLNESCSSGCGSFLETFADSLKMSIQEFAEAALEARRPVDLGSRCTVFMNSKVKQAQKEGYSVGDISAGLSYSVIKNALQKVIRVRDIADLGSNIVVQGGTFNNDAVLRAFELLAKKEVVRPNIAGLMGAYGAALIAKEKPMKAKMSTIIGKHELDLVAPVKSVKRCDLCSNKCILTVNTFTRENNETEAYVSGNKCPRGAGETLGEERLPNLYRYKRNRVFNYKSLTKEAAYRGEVGIPRVLNMYENYPFWHTFFTALGFRVVLSSPSSRDIYEKGIETMPSESVCYPGKLVHGHIFDLIERDIKFIFYPSIIYETNEFNHNDNKYNCPIVISYPEVIKGNVNYLDEMKVNYKHPFLPYDDDDRLAIRLEAEFQDFELDKKELLLAIKAARHEDASYKADILLAGKQALQYIEDHGLTGIVLAGRPYHIDKELNHGIPEMIEDLGFPVLTEDALGMIIEEKGEKLRVLNQWAYHSRLYEAAKIVANTKALELVQLNSFGCGIDAITTDQVEEILRNSGKIYTTLKIDEGNNLGAARIRIRSLKSTIEERKKIGREADGSLYHREYIYKPFTKEMGKRHTILCPEMSPIHFSLLEEAFQQSGYNLKVLPIQGKSDVDVGLKYVNNDACYPAIIVIGQLVQALESGKYDLENTSVIISQTGGGCRASNYIGLLRKALYDAGFGEISVISLNGKGLEDHPGFKITPTLLHRAVMALVYGDMLLKLLYRTRPYEKIKGTADALLEESISRIKETLGSLSLIKYKSMIKNIIVAFDNIPLDDIDKPKVGVVGEILVKFHPLANNNVVNVIEGEGGEAVVPGLLDFISYTLYNKIANNKLLAEKPSNKNLNALLIDIIELYKRPLTKILEQTDKYMVNVPISQVAQGASEILSLGHQTGEGWFLTGEMVELISHGVKNIVCTQPFGCLPNHITGKGIINVLKSKYKTANIVAVDYDPGASEVNQINRIKLMLSNADNQGDKKEKKLDITKSIKEVN